MRCPEKVNQPQKEKETGAQATTKEKRATATAGKKHVTKSYSHVLLPANVERLYALSKTNKKKA